MENFFVRGEYWFLSELLIQKLGLLRTRLRHGEHAEIHGAFSVLTPDDRSAPIADCRGQVYSRLSECLQSFAAGRPSRFLLRPKCQIMSCSAVVAMSKCLVPKKFGGGQLRCVDSALHHRCAL